MPGLDAGNLHPKAPRMGRAKATVSQAGGGRWCGSSMPGQFSPSEGGSTEPARAKCVHSLLLCLLCFSACPQGCFCKIFLYMSFQLFLFLCIFM